MPRIGDDILSKVKVVPERDATTEVDRPDTEEDETSEDELAALQSRTAPTNSSPLQNPAVGAPRRNLRRAVRDKPVMMEKPPEPPERSKHDPDGTWRHLETVFSGVILEVANTQQYRKMRELAYHYITESNGDVHAVVGLHLRDKHWRRKGYRDSKRATVYIWEPYLDEQGRLGIRTREHEVIPLLPRIKSSPTNHASAHRSFATRTATPPTVPPSVSPSSTSPATSSTTSPRTTTASLRSPISSCATG